MRVVLMNGTKHVVTGDIEFRRRREQRVITFIDENGVLQTIPLNEVVGVERALIDISQRQNKAKS